MAAICSLTNLWMKGSRSEVDWATIEGIILFKVDPGTLEAHDEVILDDAHKGLDLTDLVAALDLVVDLLLQAIGAADDDGPVMGVNFDGHSLVDIITNYGLVQGLCAPFEGEASVLAGTQRHLFELLRDALGIDGLFRDLDHRLRHRLRLHKAHAGFFFLLFLLNVSCE